MRINLIVLFILLLGCSSVRAKKQIRTPVKKKQLQKKSGSLGLRYYSSHYKYWKKYFSKKNNKRFIRYMKNGSRFKGIIEKIMEKNGLPKELYYVGMIESGFYLKAKSHASAVGPWQFIKGTGKRYGLRIDRYVDERKNIYKSTWAAAQYFKDLYNIFGSWELALCAYNAGEYRIINAIRKGNTRDYRALVSKKLLPKETILYIPKVVAAMHLALKLKKYHVKRNTVFYNARSIDLRRNANLQMIRKKLKINYNTFRILNPDVNRKQIQISSKKPFKLFIPKSKYKYLSKISNYLRPKKVRARRVAKTYRVKRGDTLSRLARKFKIPMRRLLALNEIEGSKLLIGQKLFLTKAGI